MYTKEKKWWENFPPRTKDNITRVAILFCLGVASILAVALIMSLIKPILTVLLGFVFLVVLFQGTNILSYFERQKAEKQMLAQTEQMHAESWFQLIYSMIGKLLVLPSINESLGLSLEFIDIQYNGSPIYGVGFYYILPRKELTEQETGILKRRIERRLSSLFEFERQIAYRSNMVTVMDGIVVVRF